MTEQEIQRMADNVARSQTCQICGGSKQREHAFCLPHWWALPAELRDELNRVWKCWPSTRSRVWIRAYHWLMRRENEQDKTAMMPDTEEL